MGREANCLCTAGAHSELMRAHLEAATVILRGPTLKRRIPVADISNLQVRENTLHFMADGEPVVLELGAEEAGKWLRKMQAPPPSLASKLGIHAQAPAYVSGHVDAPELLAALAHATTNHQAQARVLLAMVLNDADLAEVLALHAHAPGTALWVVLRKGNTATLGATAIRQRLREQGYMDNKVCAVSEQLTAIRFAKRQAA